MRSKRKIIVGVGNGFGIFPYHHSTPPLLERWNDLCVKEIADLRHQSFIHERQIAIRGQDHMVKYFDIQ